MARNPLYTKFLRPKTNTGATPVTDETPQAEDHEAVAPLNGETATSAPTTAPVPPPAPSADVFVVRPVTSEEWREYVYQDGFVYRVIAPKALHTKKAGGGSVRVVDMEGVGHFIAAGYRVIRWKTKPGFPEVAF